MSRQRLVLVLLLGLVLRQRQNISRVFREFSFAARAAFITGDRFTLLGICGRGVLGSGLNKADISRLENSALAEAGEGGACLGWIAGCV
eukprot:1764721-Pleurochrysis_carterae.AAC.5